PLCDSRQRSRSWATPCTARGHSLRSIAQRLLELREPELGPTYGFSFHQVTAERPKQFALAVRQNQSARNSGGVKIDHLLIVNQKAQPTFSVAVIEQSCEHPIERQLASHGCAAERTPIPDKTKVT